MRTMMEMMRKLARSPVSAETALAARRRSTRGLRKRERNSSTGTRVFRGAGTLAPKRARRAAASALLRPAKEASASVPAADRGMVSCIDLVSGNSADDATGGETDYLVVVEFEHALEHRRSVGYAEATSIDGRVAAASGKEIAALPAGNLLLRPRLRRHGASEAPKWLRAPRRPGHRSPPSSAERARAAPRGRRRRATATPSGAGPGREPGGGGAGSAPISSARWRSNPSRGTSREPSPSRSRPGSWTGEAPACRPPCRYRGR